MTVKYTEDHEWVKIEGNIATVGITVHAQDALGDVVFVDLPAVGTTFAQKETAGVVESVKAAADVYMPLSGEVTEINEALKDDPSLANSDPMGAGWFFKIKLSDPSQLDALMDETRYTAFAVCSCGKLLCLDGPGVVNCPWCNIQVGFGDRNPEDDHGFDVSRGRG